MKIRASHAMFYYIKSYTLSHHHIMEQAPDTQDRYILDKKELQKYKRGNMSLTYLKKNGHHLVSSIIYTV